MAEEIPHYPAAIDYARMPEGTEGKWVVVRKATKQPVAFGDTLEEVLLAAGITPGNAQGMVVGRIPSCLVAL